MRRACVVLLVALLAGCGSAGGGKPAATSTTPHTTTIHGTLTLSGPGNFSWDFLEGKSGPAICYGGDRGYDDIKPGASVVVTNESGTTIAVGALDDSATAIAEGSGSDATGELCKFTFTVPDVPDAKFYGVQVTHRGVVQFQPNQLSGIALTLGDG